MRKKTLSELDGMRSDVAGFVADVKRFLKELRGNVPSSLRERYTKLVQQVGDLDAPDFEILDAADLLNYEEPPGLSAHFKDGRLLCDVCQRAPADTIHLVPWATDVDQILAACPRCDPEGYWFHVASLIDDPVDWLLHLSGKNGDAVHRLVDWIGRKWAYELLGGSTATAEAPDDLGGRTAVYRYYDTDGELLYVGITTDISRREARHRERSPWFKYKVRREEKWYPTREDAAKQEAFVIRELAPRFNKREQI
jgi:predicted GIY-YIG superfamily endonuclease